MNEKFREKFKDPITMTEVSIILSNISDDVIDGDNLAECSQVVRIRKLLQERNESDALEYFNTVFVKELKNE